MKNTASICCTAHTRIRYANHIADSSLQQLLRNRKLPPFRHSRGSNWPCLLQNHYGIGGRVQRRVVNTCSHIVIVTEYDGGPGVPQKARLHCRGLDYGSSRREVSMQHSESLPPNEPYG